ncbi:MAG: PQQ-binding-like beta-propeller repeat protein [Anaerolineae bacterium]|nr:PQQ-binding-like beta-propeller repeat protein [Anaerolineae bacterium]
MKSRVLPLLFVVLVTSLLLSACGAPAAVAWPGITPVQDTAYIAYMGQVFAIRTSDGGMLWKFPEQAVGAGMYAAPAVSDDLLAVGDYNNKLHAVNPKTGSGLWEFGEAKARYIASPLILGDTVYAPNADGHLYAINRQGTLVWKFEAGQALWSQPISDGKVIYQASLGHHLYALDPQTGNLNWSVDLGGALVSTPHLDENGVIYAGTLANEVVAVDSASGKILWKTNVASGVWSSPVIKDGTLFLSNIDGMVYALKAADGSLVWKTDIGASVTGSGAITPNGVVFANDKGDVVLLSFEKGEKAWTYTSGLQLYGSPVNIQDHVLVGVTHNDKVLLAFDYSGKETWSFALPK